MLTNLKFLISTNKKKILEYSYKKKFKLNKKKILNKKIFICTEKFSKCNYDQTINIFI